MAEASITQAQYRKLANLVYRESGIDLKESKLELLRARMGKRMRRTKTATPSDYIRLIDEDKTEFMCFIDVITTNHTFFYRENKHCEYIIKNVSRETPLKIWSAASSSGEEAYSLAVQLLENRFQFKIYGSDLSDTMLAVARKGIYPAAKMKSVPLQTLHAYFQKGRGDWQDHVKIKPSVQSLVTFEKYNLISDTPRETFDIIFCRNVMIYFDHPTRQKVVNNLCSALKPGGYFFVGLSESLQGLDHRLATVMPSGYRKKK
ncbi:MAG: protein-glutamate O-methyltransferase CheR [Desulfobacteraceae bacterium]